MTARVIGRVNSNPPGYLIVGAANGVAGLDGDGKVPVGQVPEVPGSDPTALHEANNLDDVANAAAALANLGGAPLAATVAMDFTAAPAGATPTQTDTGQAVTLEYYTTHTNPPSITDLGHGKRWVANPTSDDKVATYFQVHNGDNVVGVAASWTQSALDTGQVGAGGITLIAWDADYTVNVGGTPVPISRCHFTIVPGSRVWTYEVIDGAGHAAVVKTDKYGANPAADGVARFSAAVFIDTANGKAYLTLPDNSVVTLTDADVTTATAGVGGWATGNTFATIPAHYAVVEHFCSATSVSYAKLPEICTFAAYTDSGSWSARTARAATPGDVARMVGDYRPANSSITAQQLSPSAFSRTGLAPNSSFEDTGNAYTAGIAGWNTSTTGVGSTATRVVNTARATNGTAMLALTPGGTGGGFVTYAVSDLFPVQAGQAYTGRAMLGASGSSANGLWVRAIWYQSDGVTQVSVSEITPANSAIVSNATNSTAVEGVVLAPTGACYARLQIINQTPATAVTLYVDSFDLLSLSPRGLLGLTDWAATTVYAAGQVVRSPAGAYVAGRKTLVQALTGFTSGGSFSTANWSRLTEQANPGDPAVKAATMPRREINASSVPGSGNLFIAMVDVAETTTITGINLNVSVAFVGSTLARVQVGSWDDGTLTFTPLAESDELHATLNAVAANGIFTAPLFNSGRLGSTPTTLTLQPGTRYAYSAVVVGQSAGSWRSNAQSPSIFNLTPVLARQKASMTDGPTAALVGAATTSSGVQLFGYGT